MAKETEVNPIDALVQLFHEAKGDPNLIASAEGAMAEVLAAEGAGARAAVAEGVAFELLARSKRK